MLLGAGGSSKVYSCYDQWGGTYAIKILRKDKNFKDSVAQDMFIKEFQVMEMLKKHPNILNSHFINLDGVLEVNGEKEGIVYSILELAKKGSTT